MKIVPLLFISLFASLATCNKIDKKYHLRTTTKTKFQAHISFGGPEEENGQTNNTVKKTNVPDIGNNFFFYSVNASEAWCNESTKLAKNNPKNGCKFPFQYRNATYHGCVKLIEADRKQQEYNLVDDVFFCPTKNIRDGREWLVGKCQNDCPKIFPQNSQDTGSKSMTRTVLITSAVVVATIAAIATMCYFVRRRLNKDTNVNQTTPPFVIEHGVKFRHPAGVVNDVEEPTKRTNNMSKNPASERLAQSLCRGDTSKLDPNIFLNEQVNFIPYNPNREMDRKDFTTGDMLGSGNFGTVFKGEANSLFYPGSKTKVAVKTTHNSSNQHAIDSFLAEIKILSNLDLHCNLVNMVGSNTSKVRESGEMWLLLEYCQKGDLKVFLVKNREMFKASLSQSGCYNNLESRLLIRWAYDIAKGMEYLASKRIMHGDLAARNVLIDCGEKDCQIMVAKIADFGLSKKIATKNYYRKMERNLVPWKWMAFEFLEDGVFRVKSDVWSYGVVIWELFSLGENPYGNKSYEEVFKNLKKGKYLQCPEIINEIQTWPAKQIYDDLAKRCFVLDEKKRSSFQQLADFIKLKLNAQELRKYEEVTNSFLTKNQFLLDNEALSKFSKQSTEGESNISILRSQSAK